MSALHIRHGGQSLDIALETLDLGDLSSDQEIRVAVAAHLEKPEANFADHTIDRNVTTGDITLRPQAVFGN